MKEIIVFVPIYTNTRQCQMSDDARYSTLKSTQNASQVLNEETKLRKLFFLTLSIFCLNLNVVQKLKKYATG